MCFISNQIHSWRLKGLFYKLFPAKVLLQLQEKKPTVNTLITGMYKGIYKIIQIIRAL